MWRKVLWWWNREQEDDLEEEFQAHLAIDARERRESGLNPREAEVAARRAFGNQTLLAEKARDVWRFIWLDELWRDVRYSLRQLMRSRGFTVVALLSLALGIGANTAIFSLVNGFLLRPLDYPDSDRLVTVRRIIEQRPNPIPWTGLDYYAFREQMQTFSAMGAQFLTSNSSFGPSELGHPAERILGQQVSAGLLDAVGVQPALGRFFNDTEDKADQVANVVVISDRLWKRRFAADPDVINTVVPIDGVDFTIIGVMPPGFQFFVDGAEFWKPIPLTGPMAFSPNLTLQTVGRLKPGVSMEQAQAELDAFHEHQKASYPERDFGSQFRIDPLQETMFGNWRESLLPLQVAVGFVLLIGCANVAGLLLARATSRRSEIALRAAVGASRRRIAWQLIVETLPLSVLGGALGIVFAWAGLQAFIAIAPSGYLRLKEFPLDDRVLGFTLAITLVTTLIFALAPALQASKTDLSKFLKEGGRGSRNSHQRLRSVMVAGQIALSLVLLIGAGLMINSLLHVQGNSLGGNPEGILTFDIRFSQEETLPRTPLQVYRQAGLFSVYPEVGQLTGRVIDRLKQVPGVESVAAATARPFDGAYRVPFLHNGQAPPANGQPVPNQRAGYIAVTPGYFSTVGLQLQGRDFTDRDTASSPPVIVINQAMAEQFWPGEDPLGKFMRLDYVLDEPLRQVVGIVSNMRTYRYQNEFPPLMFIPEQQQPATWLGANWTVRSGMFYLIRSSQPIELLIPAITQAVADVDPNRPPGNFVTTDTYLASQIQYDRMNMTLLTVFGAIAVLLAAIGIYGVMAYAVAERTREIGIRIAMGASTSVVVRLVLRHALLLITVGLALGLIAAYFLTRFIESFLYQVQPTDPVTFAAVSALMVTIALLACLIPVQRAIHVDPMVTLRYE